MSFKEPIADQTDIPTERMKELPATGKKASAPIADPSQAEAEAIIAHLNLPGNLRGRCINLVGFNSDEDCGYFYPGRTRAQQEYICAALRARLAPLGAQFTRTFIRPEMMGDPSAHPGGPAHFADTYNYLAPIAKDVEAGG